MIKKYIFMTLLMVWAQHSVAYTCTNKTPSTQATFTTNNISIAANVPVGTEIARATTGTVATFSCVDGSPSDLKHQLLGVKGLGTYLMNLGDKRIYSTNIKGIGYAVHGEDDRCGGNGVFVGQNTVSGDGNLNNSWMCGINGSSATGPLRVRGEIVFYKIAEFTGSGVLSIGNAASFILQVNQAQWIYPETNITIAPYSISSRACEVSQTSINVPMGSVPKNHFNGIGTAAFASHTQNFTIGLNCNPDTKIKVKLDGNIQNANQGILNLTSSDTTAKGVGIQLLFNNSPLILGQPFYIGTSNTNGLYNINLSARYYQIGNISSGTANSTATFTMTYE